MIGLVGTMTGSGAWRGGDAFEGAEVGVRALNAERSGARFALVTLDDRGDPRVARELVERFAAAPRTVGVIYAGPPRGLVGAESALAQAGVPALLCYGDLYGARRLRPHLFQVSPSFLWEARRIASYLTLDRRYRSLGMLTERSLTGTTAVRALRSALTELARPPATALRYTHGRPTFERRLRRLRARGVDAVVFEGGPRAFAAVARTLDRMDASYKTTALAKRGRSWHPQLVGFDLALSPRPTPLPPGTVAAETYARGEHYLPIPSVAAFRSAFVDWWDSEPLGWQRRAFEAARMIGWAVERSDRTAEGVPTGDLAQTLEGIKRLRFGGLDVTLGPDDHTTVNETDVGLWVVPRRSEALAGVPRNLPWVPLARGFSINGRRTIVAPRDWKHLFRDPPPRRGPAPRLTTMRFGIATKKRDPVH